MTFGLTTRFCLQLELNSNPLLAYLSAAVDYLSASSPFSLFFSLSLSRILLCLTAKRQTRWKSCASTAPLV